MLKKVLALACLSATGAAFAASAPVVSTLSPFQGFFGAFGLGVVGYTPKISSQQYAGADAQGSENLGAAGFGGEILAGYDYVMKQRWVLGLTANYVLNAARINVRHSRTDLTASNKFTAPYFFGANIQLGFLPSQTAMVFVNVGPEWGHFNTSSKVNGATASKNFSKLGLNVEVGSKQAICSSRWFIQEKIGYMTFGTKTLVHRNNYTAKIQPRVITGMLDIGYTF